MYWQLSRPNKKSGNLGYSLPSLFLGLFLRKRKPIRQWSMKHLGNKPVPLKLVSNPPQFGIDRLDLLHMSLGPSPVLRVRRYGPGSAFLGSRSGAPAAMQLAAVSTSNGGVLAKCSSTGFSQASRARPTRPKTRCHARFDKFCVVNFIHYSPPPLTG